LAELAFHAVDLGELGGRAGFDRVVVQEGFESGFAGLFDEGDVAGFGPMDFGFDFID
jgi:hypothetical protein